MTGVAKHGGLQFEVLPEINIPAFKVYACIDGAFDNALTMTF